MKKEEVFIVEDKSKIESIILKYPHLMADDAISKYKDIYYSLLKTKQDLQEARQTVRDLEDKIKEEELIWNTISPLVNITFANKSKTISIESSRVIIKGDGNDILGRSTRL
jgi:hypothetical protein